MPEPVTVAFATLGCKLNQYDTTELQARLEARGLRTVSFEEPAQLYVINTCTVTARADGSGRQAIRRAVARNPDALVVSTASWGYLRLRRTEYAAGELAAWARRVERQPWEEAYVFFKHEDEGKGPLYAERFREELT